MYNNENNDPLGSSEISDDPKISKFVSCNSISIYTAEGILCTYLYHNLNQMYDRCTTYIIQTVKITKFLSYNSVSIYTAEGILCSYLYHNLKQMYDRCTTKIIQTVKITKLSLVIYILIHKQSILHIYNIFLLYYV